jgi:hypothetical protein
MYRKRRSSSSIQSNNNANTTKGTVYSPGMLINPNNTILHQNTNNAQHLKSLKFIEAIKTTIDYPSTVRKFLQKQKQQNLNITKK